MTAPMPNRREADRRARQAFMRRTGNLVVSADNSRTIDRRKPADTLDNLQTMLDAAAFRLIEEFHLQIGKTLRTPKDQFGTWVVSRTNKHEFVNADLKTAITNCVASIRALSAARKA